MFIEGWDKYMTCEKLWDGKEGGQYGNVEIYEESRE